MSAGLLERNPADVDRLRAAGHQVTTDDELVTAYARELGVSRHTARLTLEDRLEDVVDVEDV